MFKKALIGSGLLAGLALTSPGIVVLGFFLLIIPGVVLMIAPTIFVYLLLIAAFRLLLPLPRGVVGWIAAFLFAIFTGWAAMQPMRWIETRAWEAQLKPDVSPRAPLALQGEILLDLPAQRGRKEAECDHLCAGLLATPGVSGVILDNGASRTRFSLSPRGSVPDRGLRPKSPEMILNLFDKVDRDRAGGKGKTRPWEQTRTMQQAIAAGWTLRLNTEKTLMAAPIGAAAPTDWTVRVTDHREKDEPYVRRLEIHEGGSQLRLRRSLVTHSVLAPFFSFEFAGGMENPHFRVARTELSSGARYAEFDPAYEILAHSIVQRPAAREGAEDSLRRAIIAALDDPSAGPDRMLVARDWLQQLGYKVSERDEPLVLRIAEDRRVTDIAEIFGRFYQDGAPVAFRHAFVRRIVDPAASADDRDYYARMLARMPVGTFAEPTPDELAIWSDRRLYMDAAPFLERLADTGPLGLRRIEALLHEAAAIPSWADRRPLVRELRRGLARMGKDASPALPSVLSLYRRAGTPLVNVWQESQAWYVTFALMGLPVEQIPFPDSFSPEQIAREREQVRQEVARYDPDKRSGYNY